ncbi:MAG TPA: lipoprotein [Anaerolineales bacterium]|nr:lipoprotein [Anaerolineales bacterium]
MKKLLFFLVILLLLSGCSGSPISIPFLQTPVPPSSPQPTVTPFSLEPTSTPNLFVLNTLPPTTTPSTQTPIVTTTALPTFTPTIRSTITLEPLNPNFFTPSPNIFLAVQRSTDVIVWGSTCEGARSIQFTAQVKPARRLRFVTLWYRLQDKYSGRHTDWSGGAILSDNDQGTYFYDLTLSQIQRYRFFEDAWFQYQLVASTVTQDVLGRSVVSRSEVSLTHCKVLNP